jgi:hypothetical protein
MSAPAGWYPDASGTLRWWDGARWAEGAPPVAQGQTAPPGRVAPGTPAGNVWIWLIVVVPILAGIASTIYLGQMSSSLSGLVGAITTQTSAPDSQAIMQWELTSVFTPAYFLLMLVGLATYGVSVWFGYRDFRELEARGFVRPFHWAWLFLSPWVYVIGRTTVVSRRGGRDIAPLVVFLAIQAVSLIVGMVWLYGFMTQLMNAMVSLVPTA